ncbi:MAG: radical SAM protein [Mogibacterium sp.]|nr:radical SAM protein [Mogibacterium sp.]
MTKDKGKASKQIKTCGVNRILEFHLADHCNLSCKHCAHYAPVAEPKYATMNEIAEAMRVVQLIRPRQMNVLGGEPLLHPDIDMILSYVGERIPKGVNTFLTTNGILLEKMSDNFWEVIKEHDITIHISVYPMKIDYQSIVSLAKIKGVKLAGLDYPVLRFSAVRLAEDKGFDSRHAYSSCRAKCMQVRDGRLYPCSYSAYIEHINRHYGTSFAHEDGDYLLVDSILDAGMVEQWMREPKPFCSYCNYGNESRLRWENSGEHDIEEWVERC